MILFLICAALRCSLCLPSAVCLFSNTAHLLVLDGERGIVARVACHDTLHNVCHLKSIPNLRCCHVGRQTTLLWGTPATEALLGQ